MGSAEGERVLMVASSNPSDWTTALIAVGAALVGGLTSGFFTLRGLRRQHRHELDMQIRQRSHDAARALIASILAFDRAVADWMSQPFHGGPAQDRYNDFARDLAAEGFELLDDELRTRLDIHMRLCHQVLGVIAARHQAPDATGMRLLGVLRSHCIAMCRALTSHIRGERSLPPYQPFDASSVQAVLAWGDQAEQAR
jgi:hypothetical protein